MKLRNIACGRLGHNFLSPSYAHPTRSIYICKTCENNLTCFHLLWIWQRHHSICQYSEKLIFHFDGDTVFKDLQRRYEALFPIPIIPMNPKCSLVCRWSRSMFRTGTEDGRPATSSLRKTTPNSSSKSQIQRCRRSNQSLDVAPTDPPLALYSLRTGRKYYDGSRHIRRRVTIRRWWSTTAIWTASWWNLGRTTPDSEGSILGAASQWKTFIKLTVTTQWKTGRKACHYGWPPTISPASFRQDMDEMKDDLLCWWRRARSGYFQWTVNVEWSSDIDGVLGSVSPIVLEMSGFHSGLSLGVHLITLTVQDDQGL